MHEKKSGDYNKYFLKANKYVVIFSNTLYFIYDQNTFRLRVDFQI